VEDTLDAIEALAPGGVFADAAVAAGLDYVCYDDGVEPRLWLGPRGSASALAELEAVLSDAPGGELPDDLRAILRRHDGIAVVATEDHTIPEPDADCARLLGASGIVEAWGVLSDIAAIHRLPRGLLPFFVLDAADVAYDCVVLTPGPSEGVVVRVYGRGSDPARPAELESYPVVATSIAAWLDAWLAAGLDTLSMHSEVPARPQVPPGAVKVGDLFTLPEEYGSTGKGYNWATRIEMFDGEPWVRFFTFAHTSEEFARLPGPHGIEAKTARLSTCERIDPAKRKTILALAGPTSLEELPGYENREEADVPPSEPAEASPGDDRLIVLGVALFVAVLVALVLLFR
ncbi:MAG: hypothetical protein DRJ42_20890, partial [Deltaproteobacteria bacterium]